MAKSKNRALNVDEDRMEIVFAATAELERIFLDIRSQVTAVETDDHDDARAANTIHPAILDCVARRGLILTEAIHRTFDNNEKTADLERLVSK